MEYVYEYVYQVMCGGMKFLGYGPWMSMVISGTGMKKQIKYRNICCSWQVRLGPCLSTQGMDQGKVNYTSAAEGLVSLADNVTKITGKIHGTRKQEPEWPWEFPPRALNWTEEGIPFR